MGTYLDSGSLVKLYVMEPGSPRVEKVARSAERLILVPLQLLEVRTAIRAAAGRGLLSEEAMQQTLANLDADVASGCFDVRDPLWETIWERAEALSASHVAKLLTRTLDVLHVAIALELEAAPFVTGDKRQQALAREVGLQVVEV